MGRRQTRVDVCRRSCIQLDLDHTLAAVDRLIHSDAWGMGVSGPENSETLPSFQGDLICGAVIEPDVPIRAASTSSVMSSRGATPIFSSPWIRN